MPQDLLVTKMYLPQIRENLVARPRLIEMLEEGWDKGHRLTLVSAPAGYGKTTILAKWIQDSCIPAAWLSLDKGDNNPNRFWIYLISAVRKITMLQEADVGQVALAALQSNDPPPLEQTVNGLINDLAALSGRSVLVLDDLHQITEPSIHEGLVFLVEHIPPNNRGLHLVVSSRKDPPWPMARLRARALITELRAPDLRFTVSETEDFFQKTIGLRLSQELAHALEARTEGWIAGLQMAAISLQGYHQSEGDAGVARFVRAFTGSHRFIMDYLLEEVLSYQPPQVREFLLKTSVLERLTAQLCDAVLGGKRTRLTDKQDDAFSASRDILDYLERSNLFLVSLDDQRHWYRYHHLFGQLLRNRLANTYPEEISRLHSSASEWLERNGHLHEAVLHALAAEDIDQIVQLVMGNALLMAEHDELTTVLLHLDGIPEDRVRGSPWLCVSSAWVRVFMGQFEAAELLIQQGREASARLRGDAEMKRLNGHLSALWGYIEWIKGSGVKARQLACQALEMIPISDRLGRGNALVIIGLSSVSCLDSEAAVHAYQQAAAIGQEIGNQYLYVFASSSLAYTFFIQTRLQEAYEGCQAIIKRMEGLSASVERLPVYANVYSTLSSVLCFRYDLEGALGYAIKAVSVAEKWKQVDSLMFALTSLTIVYLALKDYENARATIQREKRLASSVSDWFVEIAEQQEAMLNIAAGNLEPVAQWVEEVQLRMKDGQVRAAPFTTIIFFYLAQKEYARASSLIDELLESARESKFAPQHLTGMILKVYCLQAQGQTKTALTLLEEALVLAAQQGDRYDFLRLGDPMRAMLSQYRQQTKQEARHPQVMQFVDQLLAIFAEHEHLHKHECKKSSPVLRVMPSLSRRELEVLRWLDTTLSVGEIAQELFVVESTVRTHIKSIYKKLGVHKRLEATQRARDLKLL